MFDAPTNFLSNLFLNVLIVSFIVSSQTRKSKRIKEDDEQSQVMSVPRTAIRLARGIKDSLVEVLVKIGGGLNEEVVERIGTSAPFSSPNENNKSVPSQEAESSCSTNQMTGNENVETPVKILFPGTDDNYPMDTITHNLARSGRVDTATNLHSVSNQIRSKRVRSESSSLEESDANFEPELGAHHHDLNIPNGEEDIDYHDIMFPAEHGEGNTASCITQASMHQLQNESTSPEINEEFPMLSALNISTDMAKLENQIKMFKLINEINRLGKNNREMQNMMLENIEAITKPQENPDAAIFNRTKTGHLGLAYFTSGYNSFNSWRNALGKQVKKSPGKNEPKENRFMQFVTFLGQNKKDSDVGDEQKGAGFILRAIEKWYPQTTEAFVKKKAQEFMRLSPEETAAVLSEVNMSTHAWNGVNRLVASFRGFYLSATRKLLGKFTERVPDAEINHFDFVYDESKDPERIDYFVIEISELTTKLIERELLVPLRQEGPEMFYSESMGGMFFQTMDDRERCQSSELPKYGYETFDSKLSQTSGIYALLTSDHGKGASLGVIRFLLEPSDERRKRNSPDYGTISFPFYRMVCKKDPGEVVDYLAPYVNRGIDVLSKSRLVAARNRKNQLRCFLVPKKAMIISVLLLKKNEEVMKLYCLYIDEDGRGGHAEADATDSDDNHFDYWTAVRNFDVCGIADLLFVLMAQGREGMASSRCMHCDLTMKEWSDNTMVGKNITLSDLILTNSTRLGCKTYPLWNLCPIKWITPLLHEEMGMVNKLFFHMMHYLLTKLDSTTEEEAGDRYKLKNEIDLREGLEEDLEELKYNHELAKKQLTKDRSKLGRELKKATNDGNNDTVEQINVQIKEIIDTREEMTKERDLKQNELDEIESSIEKLRKRIKEYVENRKKVKGSLDGRLEDVSMFCFS